MTRPAEVTAVHTRILRCTLAVPDARAYWSVPDPGPMGDRSDRAFREFWFGARSHARVAVLLANLRMRFDAYPEAASVLRAWPDMEPTTRTVICHWHLQLADPLYRAFTGAFLPQRRAEARPEITRARVVGWVGEQDAEKWTMSTRIAFATKLLSAAVEAGLVLSTRDPRPLGLPRVPDDALGYLLHLLRNVTFEGTLLDNPYLASVGLTGAQVDARLRALPGLTFSRQAGVVDATWEHDSLPSWFASWHPGPDR